MKMHSLFRYMYDAAPSVSLRAKDAAAITASGALTGITLDQLEGYWTSGELADKTVAVVVNVTAVDTANGTYDIALEAGPVGFGTSKAIHKLNGITKTGQYVMLVDFDTVTLLKNDAAAIRLNVTANDTDGAGANEPSITFHAFLSPVQA